MSPTQRPTFSWRVIGGGGGFSYLLASGGSGSGSINFDFTTGSLPAGITFTRPSIGTYNSSGNILTTASSNVARFNYISGVANLLIEGSATNLFTNSNNFSAWSTLGSPTISSGQFVSPDGTNNGWSIAGAGDAYATYGLITFSLVPYTVSVWAKYITNTAPVILAVPGATPTVSTSVSLARVFTAVTPTVVSGNAGIGIRGPGTNGIYGAQIEIGSVMTSYIPTLGAAVTRAADNAVFTIPSGINQLLYTFDDNSTQTVAVSPGSYTIPTTLSRPNIKSVVGRYAFDFTSGSLPAGMTFTRPSIGTYTNAGGTLITAGNDVARLNYVSGAANLLVEGSATNLLLQSNSFTTTPWSTGNGAVLTPAQFTSPDGTNNGWSIDTGTNGLGLTSQSFTYLNTPYVMSVWAKLITGSAQMQFYVNGTLGAITLSSTIARRSSTTTPSAGSGPTYIQMFGTIGHVNGMYGAQLETGSVPTSYIPTTTAAVTRAADAAVLTIPAGIGHLTYTFDDNTTQLVTVSAGSYTIPVTLNRPNIKSIVGSA